MDAAPSDGAGNAYAGETTLLTNAVSRKGVKNALVILRTVLFSKPP